MRYTKCPICGKIVSPLSVHIGQQHGDLLLELDLNTRQISAKYGISAWTVVEAIKVSELRPQKRCPRCGEHYNGIGVHLFEKHINLLLCARYALKLEHKDVAAMFFNGQITKASITQAYYWARQSGMDIQEIRSTLPKLAIPIMITDNSIKTMDIGEVGIGLIYADPNLSWREI